MTQNLLTKLETLKSGSEDCPACLGPIESFDQECRECGTQPRSYVRASLARVISHQSSALSHLTSRQCEDLVNRWDLLSAVYNDQRSHEDFFHVCLQKEALSFAALMYRSKSQMDPYDEIAKIMLKRVKLLASATVPTVTTLKRRPFVHPMIHGGFKAVAILMVIAGLFLYIYGLWLLPEITKEVVCGLFIVLSGVYIMFSPLCRGEDIY